MEIPSFALHISEENTTNIPDYLYHYTSLAAFEKIIKSANILLFNSYQLNDYMENNVLLSILDLVLFENKSLFPETYVNALNSTFLNKYRLSLPYVACLSSKFNSLSQWRNYGDDCNGVCIKISTKTLGLRYCLPHQNVDSKYLYSIHNIIYSIEEQKKIVLDALKYAMVLSNQLENDNIKHEAFAEHAFMVLSRFMSTFKTQEFSEEYEWRIIYMPWLMGNQDGNVFTYDGRKDIGFLTTRNMIKSYFPLFNEVEKFQKSIDEVQLGTKSEVSDFEIKTFLDYYKMRHVKYSRSTITYR